MVGFDINQKRIDELRAGKDLTLEVEDDILQAVLAESNPLSTGNNGLWCSNQLTDIDDANFYVVTVPTPVDKNNRPDLTPLYKASETVGKVLKKAISWCMNLQYIQVLLKKNVFRY